ESREKFNNVKIVHAASGVKVAAPNLEDTLAGSSLFVAINHEEEQKIQEELKEIEIEQDAVGPIIRADTLGALEALVKLLGEKKIKPRRARVGEVTRKDVIEAHAVQEKDPFKGVVFAFNVKVLPEAIEEAKKNKVRIFKENVIYKLLEDYAIWKLEVQEAEKQKTLTNIVFPARIKLLPNHVFRNSKPAIVGVRILEGRLKIDCHLVHLNGNKVGEVQAIQSENKAVQEAKKNTEVAISISGAHAVVGKDIQEGQELIVSLSHKNMSELEKVSEELSQEEKELIEEIKKIKQKRGDKE
ncbi:translation initiation factor IF-2, partial [Candidatus Micrarchaeota archaeon]|nr:translation initiation factor IF-2 [Candidatus Micrarchaeota archaeon]